MSEVKEKVKQKEQEKEEEIVIEDEVSSKALLKEAQAQLMKNYIEKEYPGFGKVKIYHPTIAVETELDIKYTEEFNKVLMDKSNIPTETQLEEILDERGSWTKKHSDKIDLTRDSMETDYTEIAKLRSKRNKYNKKITDLNIKKLQDNVLKKSKELIKLISSRNRLFDGTAESYVEKIIMKLKLIKCVMKDDDTPKWNSVEELDKEFGTQLLPLIKDCQKFWAGMSDPLFDESLNQAFGDLDIELQ